MRMEKQAIATYFSIQKQYSFDLIILLFIFVLNYFIKTYS